MLNQKQCFGQQIQQGWSIKVQGTVGWPQQTRAMEAGGSTLMGRGVQQVSSPTEVLWHTTNTMTISPSWALLLLYVLKALESSQLSFLTFNWNQWWKWRKREVMMKERTSSCSFLEVDGQVYMSECCSCRLLESLLRSDGCENRAVAEPSHSTPHIQSIRAGAPSSNLQGCLKTCLDALVHIQTPPKCFPAIFTPFLPWLQSAHLCSECQYYGILNAVNLTTA